jgi:hypothetical protein
MYSVIKIKMGQFSNMFDEEIMQDKIMIVEDDKLIANKRDRNDVKNEK